MTDDPLRLVEMRVVACRVVCSACAYLGPRGEPIADDPIEPPPAVDQPQLWEERS